MIHRTTADFWECYHALPQYVRDIADKNYDLLEQNQSHPSLRFKRVGRFWSVRVGLYHRALALPMGDEMVWFWIGSHAEYDQLIKC